MQSGIRKVLKLKTQNLILTAKRLADPKKKLQDYAFRNDELLSRLEQAIKVYFSHLSKDIQLLEKKLVSPKDVIQRLRSSIEKSQYRLSRAIEVKIHKLEFSLKNNMGKLGSLSPLAVVDRGYSIATNRGKVVKSLADVKVNDLIEVRVSDGSFSAEIKKVMPNIRSE